MATFNSSTTNKRLLKDRHEAVAAVFAAFGAQTLVFNFFLIAHLCFWSVLCFLAVILCMICCKNPRE